jgi:hypothetical protein
MMHLLHMAWVRGPSAAQGVTIGIGVCGARVPAGEFAALREDTTCPQCLARLERGETAAPEVGPAPPKKDKTRTSMLRRAKR